jgi:putative acetyltransferase
MLAAIFVASIGELTSDDYDPNQQAAWASVADDEDAFARRLSDLLTLVATVDGAPVAFASLKVPDSLEMLYVHPSAAGQGVAAGLCDACEKLAKARGAAELTVQASDTAQGFFGRRGYQARQRGTVTIGDEWLGRTTMVKTLGGPSAPS